MAGVRGNLSFIRNDHGSSLSALFARIAKTALQTTTFCRNWTGSILSSVSSGVWRSEEHTSELQSLMRISYAVFCLKKKKRKNNEKKGMLNTLENNTSTAIQQDTNRTEYKHV